MKPAMNLYTALLVMCVLSPSLEYCNLDERSLQNSWEGKLLEHLHCNYNGRLSPKYNGTDGVEVKLRYILRSYFLDEENQVFGISVWMFMYWEDDRLKWDPEEYGGIDETTMKSFNIWVPDFKIINAVTEFIEKSSVDVPCTIKHSGNVHCPYLFIVDRKCYLKWANWPYDTQECILELGVGNHVGYESKLKLNVGKKALSMLGTEHGTEWTITGYKQELNHTADTKFTMKFTLERESAGLAAITLYPGILLGILSLSCMILDVRRSCRLYMICFSLVCHLYYLKVLRQYVPNSTVDVPTILLFYRGSLLVTITLVIQSFMLSVLSAKKTAVPHFVVKINNYVYNSFDTFLVWLCRESNRNSADVNKPTEGWMDFIYIINTLFIIIVVIVYFSMYLSLMPQRI